jgi:hypothetical protein
LQRAQKRGNFLQERKDSARAEDKRLCERLAAPDEDIVAPNINT